MGSCGGRRLTRRTVCADLGSRCVTLPAGHRRGSEVPDIDIIAVGEVAGDYDLVVPLDQLPQVPAIGAHLAEDFIYRCLGFTWIPDPLLDHLPAGSSVAPVWLTLAVPVLNFLHPVRSFSWPVTGASGASSAS